MDELKMLSRTLDFYENDHSTIYTAEQMQGLGFVRINHIDTGLKGLESGEPTFLRKGIEGFMYMFADHTDKSGHRGEGYVFLKKRHAAFSAVVYTENGMARVL
ncbi:MAG: hypothetical protein ABIA12_01130 [Candidatus Aenigmatarchaeota archaeon]